MKKNILFLPLLLLLLLMVAGCSQQAADRVVKSHDGVEISYSVYGKGSPALVFVHGWSCDQTYWKYQVPEFSKHYTVVTLDYAGHGKSGAGRENFTMESFGGDVSAVVHDLNLDQAILVGHSMGGYVIIDAAAKLPGKVVALVGIDTYEQLVDTVFTRQMMEQFTAPFYTDFPNSVKAFVQGMFPAGADSALVEQVSDDMASAPKKVAMSAFENMFEYSTRLENVLETIDLPFYAVSSDFYPTNAEDNRKYVKSFEVKIMEGYGHFLMMENPELFNRLLGETLDEIISN
jgi:pimeloyl-ACP methyl ester carboxylesterase